MTKFFLVAWIQNNAKIRYHKLEQKNFGSGEKEIFSTFSYCFLFLSIMPILFSLSTIEISSVKAERQNYKWYNSKMILNYGEEFMMQHKVLSELPIQWQFYISSAHWEEIRVKIFFFTDRENRPYAALEKVSTESLQSAIFAIVIRLKTFLKSGDGKEFLSKPISSSTFINVCVRLNWQENNKRNKKLRMDIFLI